MTKVIAIGDLHLKMVPGVNKAWQIARYKQFINDLILECEEKKAILAIAGDTLDSTDPKKEELQLLMYLLHELAKREITTLLVSGNHETVRKGESYLDYLEVSQFQNVFYRRNLVTEDAVFHLVNHDSLHVAPKLVKDKVNILISHFRCNYNQFVTEEIDVDSFTKGFDLCVIGDIHDSFHLGNVMYTNNPVNKEFDSNPSCGYLEVTIDGGFTHVDRIKTNYPMLLGRKIKAKDFEAARLSFAFANEHYFRVEVEGSPEELKAISDETKNIILIKMPIVESVLALPEVESIQPAGNIEDELIGYMQELKFSDDYVAAMMKELRSDL